jgi:Coenzyme PQQ synthesis protein D (PqqD)
MLTISRSARLSKSSDGGILLDVERGLVFSLNPVGIRIVELLQDGNDVLRLANTISQEFRISQEIARTDIADFLTALQEQHLLNDTCPNRRSTDRGA